nr:FAD-dependent oxidoreductase [Bryobacter sp.]
PHFRSFYSAEYLGKPGIEYTHHGQFSAEIKARDAKGNLLWGISPERPGPEGSADKRVQAFCFRLIATQKPDLRVAWPKPKRYQPHRYELLLRYIQAHPGISFARLVHFSAIPNGKFDLNASGPFSIDYVGGNYDYPDGDYATRDRVFADHLDYQKGFLWFLAHDKRVPAQLRDEVNSWGLCRDEYPDTGHWPVQLYIRECRRMKGAFVMTEHDILTNNTKEDSIGMGSFVLDSHWVQRFENEQGHVRIEGHLDESIQLATRPYEIPYRAITPARSECSNLLVPVCLSATHVAICTIRMEPVYMMMGHAAGLAALEAARSGAPVQDINIIPGLLRQGGVLHKSQARKLPSTSAA